MVESKQWQVWVRSDREKDGSAEADRPHTSGRVFASEDEALEWIEGSAEFFEQDYLEENGPEIARQERYEMWRNEY
jgi:hypothetical protein